MSYIELPSGSQALLADVLQCCLFQRKYRTPLTASVGPSSLFFVGGKKERVGLVPTSLGADFQTRFTPFNAQLVQCATMREREGGKV